MDVRKHRLENADRVREYDRSRSANPERVAARRASYAREKEMFPEKIAARYAVSNALRDGRTKKLPCAFCGKDKGLEAHHHDYAKPLDVTWLCRPCHRRFHALERMATY